MVLAGIRLLNCNFAVPYLLTANIFVLLFSKKTSVIFFGQLKITPKIYTDNPLKDGYQDKSKKEEHHNGWCSE